MLSWSLWMGVSTGLGYSVQRAIKHRLDSGSMPALRRAFWDRWTDAMVLGWASIWAAFTAWKWNELRLEHHLALLAILTALGLLYSMVPGQRQGLRALPWLKIPLIATAWTLATIPSPLEASPWFFASRWLLIAGLTLPFDVRDLAVDTPRISTLPMAWGGRVSLRVSACLLTASALCFLASPVSNTCSLLGILTMAQGPLAAAIVTSSTFEKTMIQGSDVQREWWTGVVLDGVLWIPLLGGLCDLDC